MKCLLCHGLMVTSRLEDAGGSSPSVPGWRCLICAEVTDLVISVNREAPHEPAKPRGGGRPRYGTSLPAASKSRL